MKSLGSFGIPFATSYLLYTSKYFEVRSILANLNGRLRLLACDHGTCTNNNIQPLV